MEPENTDYKKDIVSWGLNVPTGFFQVNKYEELINMEVN
jgi:hypothetical protein